MTAPGTSRARSAERRHPLVARLDAYQRRRRWLGLPLAVAYKYVDDQGAYLTALITYYAFLSLFPLLLLFVTGLGYLLANDPSLQTRVLASALAQFPVLGSQLAGNVHSLRGNTWAVVVGAATSLYGGLGVAQAAQAALNRIWGVPRSARPDPLRARLRSLVILLVLGVGVLLTTGLTAVVTVLGGRSGDLGPGLRLVSVTGSVAVNSLLFGLAFRLLTARRLAVRELWAGAVGAAAAWQLVQLLGTYYVTHRLQGASATYGVFGIVLGLLAWLWLGAFTLVVAAEANAVRTERLWPRNLLTPFTDDVELTRADEAAYTSYARSEQHKTFETVDVDFEGPSAGPPRSDGLE